LSTDDPMRLAQGPVSEYYIRGHAPVEVAPDLPPHEGDLADVRGNKVTSTPYRYDPSLGPPVPGLPATFAPPTAMPLPTTFPPAFSALPPALAPGPAPAGEAPTALIPGGLGLLALLFSFFPWVGPRIGLGDLGDSLAGLGVDVDPAIHAVNGITASAWDLKYASYAVLLSIVSAGLVLFPALDRRLQKPAMLAVAVAASAGAVVFAVVQLAQRGGILGQALGAYNELVGDDSGVSVGISVHWAAWLSGVLIVAQFACVVALWLRERPVDARPAPKRRPASAAQDDVSFAPAPGYAPQGFTPPPYGAPQPYTPDYGALPEGRTSAS
jgi:predicted outer membrane lipoprotein